MWERSAAVTLAVNMVLQLLDAATTWFALRAGGVEGNPVARALMAVDAWLVVKAVLVALLVWMVLHVRQASNRERAAVAGVGAVFALAMTFVVVQNAAIAA